MPFELYAAQAGSDLQRQRRTVLIVDLVESVRLIELDESGVIRRWLSIIDETRQQILPRFRGRMVKSLGDGMLMLFDETSDAIAAATALHAACERRNLDVPDELRMALRIGANESDVVVGEMDVFGRGVNLAARLMQLGRDRDTIVSADVQARLLPGHDPEAEDLGLCWLKHVEEPIRAYRILHPSERKAIDRLPVAQAAPPAVAVIPLDTPLGQEPPALGELIADRLIASLSGASELRVLSRLSTRAVAGRRLSAGQMASLLGADYILSGSCRSDGSRLHLDIEFCRTHDGRVLRAEQIDADLADLSERDSVLVRQVNETVAAAIAESQLDLASTLPLPNLSAHTMLLGGIGLMHRFSRQDFARARELIEALAERWPRHPDPLAWLGRWHLFNVTQGWSPDPVASQQAAREATDRALDLDPDSSVALTVAGSVRVGLEKDLAAGAALYARALQRNPNDPMAWLLQGTAHAFRGEGAPAVGASTRALELSPLDPMRFLYDCHAAGAALAAADYARARELAARSLRANRLHLSTLRVLAIAQQLEGDGAAARATVQQLLGLDPRQSVGRFLATAPSAAYEIGRRCAHALAEAGLPP